jgi:hypothetical protein
MRISREVLLDGRLGGGRLQRLDIGRDVNGFDIGKLADQVLIVSFMLDYFLHLSPLEHPKNGWRLCLQWGRYQYDDKTEPQAGYRFIWRRPDGSLQPARGQARIPSLVDAELLI